VAEKENRRLIKQFILYIMWTETRNLIISKNPFK